jgi:hypothetical protein
VVRVDNFTVAADMEVLSPKDYFKDWPVLEGWSLNSKDLNYSLPMRLESLSRQALWINSAILMFLTSFGTTTSFSKQFSSSFSEST